MARSTGGESWKAQKSKCACSKFMVVAHGETIKAQHVVGVGGGVWRGKTLRERNDKEGGDLQFETLNM